MRSFSQWYALREAESSPTMPFGKFSGHPIDKLPDWYLKFITKPDFNWAPKYSAVRQSVEAETQRRQVLNADPAQPQAQPPITPGRPGPNYQSAGQAPAQSPKPDVAQQAGEEGLREYGIRLIGQAVRPRKPDGDEPPHNLTTDQVAKLADMVTKTLGRPAFERTQYYSEGIPPTQEKPGWLFFKYHDHGGYISAWEWGKNFSGVWEFNQYLRDHVNGVNKTEDQKLEDQLFAFKGDNNAEFDKLLEQRKRLKHKWKTHHDKANDFVADAVKFWKSKINDRD